VRVEVVPAEALVIGPEDRLILRLPNHALPEDALEAGEMMDAFNKTIREVGLAERTLILYGDGIEMGKVEA
jgi:hypothetical protein